MTNNFDFFPNLFKPEEDANGTILDPGEDIYSVDAEGNTVYNKPGESYPMLSLMVQSG